MLSIYVLIHSTLSLSLTHTLYCTVVTFQFINVMGEEGREDSCVIDVTVIQSVATAAPINLTITPTEYSPVFGPIPQFDPTSPNIATRMYVTVTAYNLVIYSVTA